MRDPFHDPFPSPAAPSWGGDGVALLTIDLQYLFSDSRGWFGRLAASQQRAELLQPRFEAIAGILPSVRRLQDAFRNRQREVIHTRIAYLTNDGREAGDAERMLRPDYAGKGVLRTSRDNEILDEVAPVGDELVFNKTSSSVFNSTDIDGALRRMGVSSLVMTGIVTEGCVEHAARDAADRGYSVAVVSDACASCLPENHEDAIERMRAGGIIAIITAEQTIRMLRRL